MLEGKKNNEKLEWLDQEFLSTKEAVELLDISKQAFYSLISRGKITRIKKGSIVLFFREEIESRKRKMPQLWEKTGYVKRRKEESYE